MEMLLTGREHLSTQLPGLQLCWDSTSLGDFKSCPRKYYLNQLCSWRAKHESHHLTFGIFFHKGGEYYDRERARGAGHESAVEYAMGRIMRETDGWESEDSKKNRTSLLRTVVWYLDEYENDVLRTHILSDEKPAVELSFRMALPYVSEAGETFSLSGHLDKVVELASGELFIQDKKTTGSSLSGFYFDGYSPHNQMSLYTIAGGVVLDRPVSGVLIDAAQIGVNFSRFARGFVTRTKAQLAEWIDGLRVWLKQAELCAKEQNWPMNENACGMYGGCAFRGICGKDPSVRKAFLSVNYHQVPWNPMEARGDEE